MSRGLQYIQNGVAVMLHTSIRAVSLKNVLRCPTKNAEFAVAAREHFEKRHPSTIPRQVAEGLLKGAGVCTGCVAAPQWPVDMSPPAEGVRVGNLQAEGVQRGRAGGKADVLSRLGVEHVVDMKQDV